MPHLFQITPPGPLFELDANFLREFEGKQPAWGPVGYLTFKRTYARPLPEGGTEEFWQTLARVVTGCYQIQQRHCALYNLPFDLDKAQASAQEMFRRAWEFKWLPPGRGLWMMGVDFVATRGGAALNNCAFVSTKDLAQDFAAPFCFLMDALMLGVGVGGDVRGAGLPLQRHETHASETYQIADSREGWVEALRLRLQEYVGGPPIEFDYSAIRPAGAPIKGFGGTSSGAAPLRQLLDVDVPGVLGGLRTLTETAIVDLFNYVGKCVIAGNVRRSAEIMFGTSDEFIQLKDPEMHGDELMDRRWASNNSIFAEVGQDYSKIAERIAKNGEPGVAWLENMRAYGRMGDAPDDRDWRVMGSNPCVEQSLESFEVCCLVETFPSKHEGFEDYVRTLKYAYLYAKTVTLVPTHVPETNRVMLRNRRIGLSQSGIVENFAKVGRREHLAWCDRGYRAVRAWDEIYSDWLCVPESIKVTSVKPSGTVSKLPGVSSGIHYPPAEFYIQRVRFAEDSPLIPPLREAGYPIEPCAYSPNTVVVEIPVRTENFLKAESDVSLWEQLANAAQLQRYWADNQVSCTVKFKQEEAHEIQSALELFEDQLKGISFLPESHGYAQAPWEPISREEYERRAAELKPLQLEGSAHDTEDAYCDGERCVLPSNA